MVVLQILGPSHELLFISARFLFCNAILVGSFWHRFLGTPIYLIPLALKKPGKYKVSKHFSTISLARISRDPNLFHPLCIKKKERTNIKQTFSSAIILAMISREPQFIRFIR